MRTEEFRNYMEKAEQINSKNKAVSSRISRANTAESILDANLDYIVADDDQMYEALCHIKSDPREQNGKIQNSVRWYYKFVNGKDFPSLASYNRSKRYW